MKKILIITFVSSFFLAQCNEPITNDHTSKMDLIEDIKKEFSSELFGGSISSGFNIEWNDPKIYLSEEFGEVYQFPIKKIASKTSKKESKTISQTTRFLIVANYLSDPEFYLLKFLENGSSTISKEFSLNFHYGFSGLNSLINSNGELVFMKKINDGSVVGLASEKKIRGDFKTDEPNARFRNYNECEIIAVYVYTDWYYLYSDGSVQYMDTLFDGIDYYEICYEGEEGDYGGGNWPGQGGGGTNNSYSEYTPSYASYDELEGYKDNMSTSELALFEELSLIDQYWYLLSAKQAIDESSDLNLIGSCTTYNGQADAFRHTLWNALSASRIGTVKTEELTTAHEDKPTPNGYNVLYYEKEKDMDLFNNQKGRNLANSNSGKDEIIEDVLNALNTGQLRYLSNLDSSNCRATANSVLTPTNGN